jgi:hypothetical protein
MKKILIAILAGLLLIGAAAAGSHHHPPAPVIGEAESCAIALAGAGAIVDYDIVAESTKKVPLKVYSGATTDTWQIDDAKVDPVSASFSAGTAFGLIAGDIKVDDEKRGHHGCGDAKVANVEIWADSASTAYNAARGSNVAEGFTATMNLANVWANECSLGSTSVAASISHGEASGVADPDAKLGEISNLVPTL